MEANWWCCFTGGPSALTGNSAFRFCLLLRWHAISVPSTALFPAARQVEVSDVESVRTVSETNQTFLERSLLAAVADQNSRVGELAAVPLTRSWPRRPFLCHGKK